MYISNIMTKKSTVIAFAAVILTASTIGFSTVALAETSTAPTSWKTSQKHIKEYLKHAPGVLGTVSAVSGNQITIAAKNKTTYTVDTTAAKIFKNRNTLISTADIKIGDTVMAQGTVSGTTVAATTVFDGKPVAGKKGQGAFPGVMGTVNNVASGTFSVTAKNGSVYSVTTTNATKIMKGSSSTTALLSDIVNGDTVMVRGQVNGQTVTAEEIFDGMPAQAHAKKTAKK